MRLSVGAGVRHVFAKRRSRKSQGWEERKKERGESTAMQECDQNGQKVSEDVLVGMKAWREQHPKATCADIETALDERVGR
jgi:hypothetical protein